MRSLMSDFFNPDPLLGITSLECQQTRLSVWDTIKLLTRDLMTHGPTKGNCPGEVNQRDHIKKTLNLYVQV